jgi:phenylalanyl-tRNA synthetase beta chain
VGRASPFHERCVVVANILVGFGLLEANLVHLSNRDAQSTRMLLTDEPIALANALTAEHNALRHSILPQLVEVLSHNKHQEFPQNIFSIGTVFKAEEETHLGIALCPGDFTAAKQLIEGVARALGKHLDVAAGDHGSFIPGRAAMLHLEKKFIGVIGEMHPEALSNFGIETPVAGIEINLGKLLR